MAEDQTLAEIAAEVEQLRKERASELAKNVEHVAENAAKSREELASKVAYAAGAEAARIDDRLGNLDSAVKRINGSIEETGTALIQLTVEVKAQREATIAREAAAKALAEAVELRTNQQVTTRTFIFSLIGAVGVISGVLWAAVSNL